MNAASADRLGINYKTLMQAKLSVGLEQSDLEKRVTALEKKLIGQKANQRAAGIC